MKELPKDDPCCGVFHEVVKWHNTMECVPFWDEILEIEYVRQSGEINMFSGALQRHCFDRGLYAAVNWIQRCHEHGVQYRFVLYSDAVKMYERDHGPSNDWITDEVKAGFLEREFNEKERVMRQQIAELRSKRKELKKRNTRL